MKLNEVFEPAHLPSGKSLDYFLRLMKMYWRSAPDISIWAAGNMIGLEGRLSSFLSVINQQPIGQMRKSMEREFEDTYQVAVDKEIKRILDNPSIDPDAAAHLSHEGTSIRWEEYWREDWLEGISETDWADKVSDMVIPIRKMIEQKVSDLFPRGATVLVHFRWRNRTDPGVFDPITEIDISLAE